jgi:hypothetical protein
MSSFDLTYGAFKFLHRPAPGNHEFYATGDTTRLQAQISSSSPSPRRNELHGSAIDLVPESFSNVNDGGNYR